MSKKYQHLWKTIKTHCKGSPKKSLNKYYRRLLAKRRKWLKIYEINISAEELDNLIIKSIGSECPFCNREITVKSGNDSISLDRMIPESRGGDNTRDNLMFVCKRCNKRKGELTYTEYKTLLNFLDNNSKEFKKYVLRQLSANTYF